MRFFILIGLVFTLNRLSVSAQVSEEEWYYYSHPHYGYSESLDREIDRMNREWEETARGLPEKVWDAIKKNKPQRQSTAQPQQSTRGGIQFSSDPMPTRSRTSGKTTTKQQQKESLKRERHRQWLEDRNAMKEEDVQRRRIRQEEEQLRREQIFREVSTREYIREGVNTQRKIDAARWRTGEGAEILDRTHTTERLMTTDSTKYFGTPSATPGRHKLRPLAFAKQNKPEVYLDNNSIPFATMKEGAIPYSEWGRLARIEYKVVSKNLVKYDALPYCKQPVWEGDWDMLHEEISNDRFNQIKAAVFFANDKKIPPIYYDSRVGKYIAELNDGNTIIALSEDGKILDFLKYVEKNDEISILSKTPDVAVNIGNNQINLTNAKFQNNGSGVSTGVNSDDKLLSLSGKSVSVSGRGEIDMHPSEISEKSGSEASGNQENMEIGLNAKYSLFENSSSVVRKRYEFGDESISGYEWKVKAGLDVSSTANTSTKKISGGVKATTAEGSIGRHYIFPVFDGYVFNEVKLSASIGYEYRYSRKKRGTEVEVSKAKSLGKIPLSFGYEIKALRYYSNNVIDKAMPYRLK